MIPPMDARSDPRRDLPSIDVVLRQPDVASLVGLFSREVVAGFARRALARVRERATTGLRLILAVIVPASFLEIALGRPIIVALLQRGQFTASAAALTGDVLALFGIGLIAFSVYLFALRVFYASSDTRTPFLLNCVQNVINIGLAVWWYQVLSLIHI